MDSKFFYELTGAHWIEQMQIAQGADLKTPFPSSRAEVELMDLLLSLYRCYCKERPKLYLREGPCRGRHSVHARKAIAKGTVVTEYLGEWSNLPQKPSSYQWGPINGLSYRNFGGMVEDGFPNLAAFHLYGVSGIPLRVIFVALENIAQDEMLTIHYGMNHSVKVHMHLEYRLEAMSQFFLKNPLEHSVQRIKELKNRSPKELGWKKSLELENLITKLRYLFQTPSALMHLLIKGIIQPQEAFHYYDQADFRYFFLSFPFQPNFRQQEVISFFDQMKTFFSTQHPSPSLELLTHVRQRIYFSFYLPGKITSAEALLWNDVFDAIQKADQPYVEFKLTQASQKEQLIQAALAYAKEVSSPLVAWLEHLTQPPVPLSPTG